MITRLCFVMVVSILVAPLAADAQPAGELHRIGFLAGGSVSSPAVGAFRQGLHELGWIEGKNIVIDYRFAENRFDRLPDLAAELVRLKVEIIVAGPTPAAVAAKKATGTIPIVMWSVGDPVGLGLIASLARPGGNVTGVSFTVGTETYGKWLDLLKEIVPKARRVAVLSNPANPSHAGAITEAKVAARSLGVHLQLVEARGPSEFEGAFAAMSKERVAALLVLADTVFLAQRARLADLAAKSRLPSMYGLREHVEAGGLMAYGPSPPDILRRAASFVDKILRGAKSSELPVEQPTKFALFINVQTAKALGLTIQPSLLMRADQVFE